MSAELLKGSPVYTVDPVLVSAVREYFELHELFPRSVLDQGEKLWKYLSPDALRLLLAIRIAWGRAITVNDRNLQSCGWRPMTSTVGAPKSGHKGGWCFDLHPGTEDDCRKLWELAWGTAGLTEIEDQKKTIGGRWVHVSARPWGLVGEKRIV